MQRSCCVGDVVSELCAVCHHARSGHGDEKAPQWEPPCWWRTNGVDCPCIGYVIAAAVPEPALDVERLLDAMNEAYTYEDDDNAVPTLPFMDDVQNFWEPFAERVIARLTAQEATR